MKMKSIENRWLELNAGHPAEWYDERSAWLAEFVTPERYATLSEALGRRTRYMTVCMENTFHAQNASAVVRHCEAFGLQEIHAIEELCRFRPNLDIVRGTDKWIDMRRYRSTFEALAALRGEGYRIVATTPHLDGATPESFDVTRGPFVLLFGTEHAGISDETVAQADEFVRIPMCGMVESLNVSASAAILIYMLSARLRMSPVEWRLTPAERSRILFRWLMESVKDSMKILDRKFPTEAGGGL